MAEQVIPYIIAELVLLIDLSLEDMVNEVSRLLRIDLKKDIDGTYEEFEGYDGRALGLQVALIKIGSGTYQLSVHPADDVDITVGEFTQTNASPWFKRVLEVIPNISIIHK